MNWKRVEVFSEFLVLGILIGVTEDVLAIKLATDEPITMEVIWIVLAIAIPFAFFGEFVVDRIDFVKLIRGRWRRRSAKRR